MAYPTTVTRVETKKRTVQMVFGEYLKISVEPELRPKVKALHKLIIKSRRAVSKKEQLTFIGCVATYIVAVLVIAYSIPVEWHFYLTIFLAAGLIMTTFVFNLVFQPRFMRRLLGKRLVKFRRTDIRIRTHVKNFPALCEPIEKVDLKYVLDSVNWEEKG